MAKRRFVKLAAVLISLTLAGTQLAGCSGKASTTNTAGNGTPAQEQKQDVASVYPLKNAPTLRIWVKNYQTDIAASHSEFAWAKEAEKKTGIKINWQHSSDDVSLEMVIASGDLPDVIMIDWPGYKGGPEKAVNDGTIIYLNDVMDKYAPNFKKFLQQHPDIDKMVKTDSSKYTYFPMVRAFPRPGQPDGAVVYGGPIVRQDWLDDLGLKLPETTDDWYNMLKAFKDKKNADAPFAVEKRNNMLQGSFGITNSFYVENGKVKFAPIEPVYKEYLQMHNKWYQEGLIDKQYGSVDSKALATKMTSGNSGASYGNMGGALESWMKAVAGKDTKYKLVAAPNPKVPGKNYPIIGNLSNRIGLVNAAISKTSKNVETAARYLDWAYSEEGSRTYSFGVEGESYKMVNGVLTIIPEVFNGPKKYYYVWSNGVYPSDSRADEQTTTPEKAEFTKRWMSEAEKYKLPPVTPTSQESGEINDIMGEVNDYVNSMYVKFIRGEEPIDRYTDFVNQLKKMGIEKAVQINQAAYDRYIKR